MSIKTNSRIAGVTFLFYIAAGIASMQLQSTATAGEGTAEKLASIAGHTTGFGVSIILDLLCNFSALVLAVTLYAITRHQDRDIAMMGFAFRAGEGIIGAANLPKTLGLLWLATSGSGAVNGTVSANSIGEYLLMPVDSSNISALFFAAGSTVFSYLFLRGRMIPAALAWLGIAASVLLVIFLPLQIAGFIRGSFYVWIPMLIFELILAFLLIIKGADIQEKNTNGL